MAEGLTPEELTTIRSKAWKSLEKRYHKDPLFGLVESLDLQLATMIHKSPLGKNNGKVDTYKPIDPNDVSEIIAAASVKLFKETILSPAFSKEIVPELRKAKVPLPDDPEKATATVSAVYGKRPEIFEKHQGSNKKATAKWHLQPGV